MAVQLANAESKCKELAAENVALKDGVTYFACGSEYGFDLFSDKQAAIDTAQEEIELHRESYLDGSGCWGEGVERAAWGIVIQSAQRVSTDGYQVSDSRHTYQTCDYQLVDTVKTPATDAFLAEVRASARNEGINYAAGRLAAAFNHGFVDKPLTEVCDVVRMILDTKEELANSTLPAADGISGEYAEKFLAEFAAQLRKGASL
ncbi:hypothetical protein [Citrobacter portucalensis]|uniref:hypothetical protein n=1 Tax=Citrobacter portucalensis TaxID=1639133 RepID=UPI002433BFF0|nr:hypothetical protein [Citrobacter portucalensis]WFZ31684.1 hypothetical protein NFK62_11720 [Citrobacter portucalensis]WFZ36684.1 hypothetical protein NFK63_11710 [Citrobacter portucalensis]